MTGLSSLFRLIKYARDLTTCSTFIFQFVFSVFVVCSIFHFQHFLQVHLPCIVISTLHRTSQSSDGLNGGTPQVWGLSVPVPRLRGREFL